MKQKEETRITFGGWYQRTTLHLTEIYDFLSKGKSRIELNKDELKHLHQKLNLKSVTREISYLDYVKAITKDDITIKYYEDGLYIFELDSDDVKGSVKLIHDYYYKNFQPAINYLFSLGAPTPKILSNLEEIHPIVITRYERDPSKFKVPEEFGDVYSKIDSMDIGVYKTPGYIFIVGNPSKKESIKLLVEMHIFFREFKHQLHRYLNIHRKVWEEISKIKEKKFIRGKEIDFFRSKLENYKQTIDLISNRINQMPSYSHTRASIARHLNIDNYLVELFRYKFEDLFNTLDYIQQIWKMTEKYVNSAIAILVETSNKASVSGIRSIQVLASVGVVTSLVSYLSRDSLPQVSKIGMYYLFFLLVSVLVVDSIIKKYFKNKKYELKFSEIERKI